MSDIYNISFVNEVRTWPKKGKEYVKIPYTNNYYLSEFLLAWKADDIISFLLPEIEKVINNTNEELETGTVLFTVIVDPVNTIFYPDAAGTDYPKIPTQDLKHVLISWKDFLLQPPYDGQKVGRRFRFWPW
ncbi:hypothetical protein [Rufibacter sp. LB8]|uniref:hypothetical protein n=1 Tax=Rufibacter sp. LB8 TaxID=2777781 RepID=UPI00178C2694|nr:hypothetical protein [Rufibacter sp. LB8]